MTTTDRELHARALHALDAVVSAALQLRQAYLDADADTMGGLELTARRNLAMLRQLQPRIDAALRAGPPAEDVDRVTAVYQ
jgi:hypothetical protein